jgi:hypothetical protein
MADLTVQNLTKDGVVPSLAAADVGGDTFANDGKTFILVENGATDVNITFAATPSSVEKPGFGTLAIENHVVTVPASTQKIIGTFPKSVFNNSSGKVSMTYDDESNVSIAAIKFQEGK